MLAKFPDPDPPPGRDPFGWLRAGCWPPRVAAPGAPPLDVLPLDVLPFDVLPFDVLPFEALPFEALPFGVLPLEVLARAYRLRLRLIIRHVTHGTTVAHQMLPRGGPVFWADRS